MENETFSPHGNRTVILKHYLVCILIFFLWTSEAADFKTY